jgi:hypothetical protein
MPPMVSPTTSRAICEPSRPARAASSARPKRPQKSISNEVEATRRASLRSSGAVVTGGGWVSVPMRERVRVNWPVTSGNSAARAWRMIASAFLHLRRRDAQVRVVGVRRGHQLVQRGVAVQCPPVGWNRGRVARGRPRELFRQAYSGRL